MERRPRGHDSQSDGEEAVCARLSAVADDLVAKGVSMDRIRVAAQTAGVLPATQLNQIDVLFRKSGEVADNVASPPPVVNTAPASTI